MGCTSSRQTRDNPSAGNLASDEIFGGDARIVKALQTDSSSSVPPALPEDFKVLARGLSPDNDFRHAPEVSAPRQALAMQSPIRAETSKKVRIAGRTRNPSSTPPESGSRTPMGPIDVQERSSPGRDVQERSHNWKDKKPFIYTTGVGLKELGSWLMGSPRDKLEINPD
ncbi:hypothetical protein MMC22_004945 [Lobaria immixta]|nr:hypothetical protein [Lobaria immixta]